VLRILGISSPASLIHFIAYEDGMFVFVNLNALKTHILHTARWKNAEVLLAEALKTDLPRNKVLGYKIVRIHNHHIIARYSSKGMCRLRDFLCVSKPSQ
jgi:hypothetical protein